METKMNIPSFVIPKAFIEMVGKGLSFATFLVGEGGLGKSWQTIQTLKELGLKPDQDYTYVSGHLSPLGLYELLHNNKTKIIILDDTDIFKSPDAVVMLKPALWCVDGVRKIDYFSTTKILERKNLPQSFLFEGRMIILANKLNLKDPNIKALVSRTNFYDVKFTLEEKKMLFRSVAQEPYKNLPVEDRMKVCEDVINMIDPSVSNLNVRTLIKAFDYYFYDKKKYKEFVEAGIERDSALSLVSELSGGSLSVKKQVDLFMEKTGLSRASFFLYRKRLEV